MNLMKRFWQDQAGVIVSTEIILVLLILVLGLVAGMASLRDAVAQELGDVGQAINHLNGSYQFSGNTNVSDTSANATTGPSTVYVDAADDNNVQTAGSEPEGMDVDGSLNGFLAAGAG